MTQFVNTTYYRLKSHFGPSHKSWAGRENATVRKTSLQLERDMFGTAYRATLRSGIITSATIHNIGEDAEVFTCFGRLLGINTSHFGWRQAPSDVAGVHAVTGAILYGHILLSAIFRPSIGESFPTHSNLTWLQIAERFLSCIQKLSTPRAALPTSGGARARRQTQVAWILATSAAIRTRQLESASDQQQLSPLADIMQQFWREHEMAHLKLMVHVVESEANQRRPCEQLTRFADVCELLPKVTVGMSVS